MEGTPSDTDEPSAETAQTVETTSVGDLTDADFIDEFDEQEGRYRVEFDSVRAPPSLAVITVVSNVTGIDPLKLDPLYESIDGDTLDALCTARGSSVSRLTFLYSGYEITVGSDDVVELVAG